MRSADAFRNGRRCVTGMVRSATVLFLMLLHAGGVRADGGVRWSEEWTVFAPLARNHPVVDTEVLRGIPDQMEISGTDLLPPLTLAPRRVKVQPGVPFNLVDVLGDAKVGVTGYVFIPLYSDAERQVTLGLGADWWMECWLNGTAIFDTLDNGNRHSPFGILNHKVKVNLRRGDNMLAIRFIRGASSAILAVGDETHFAAEEARLAERLRGRSLNVLPENFADRLIFPADEQATATAHWNIDLDLPDADMAAGDLAGLRPMPERQIYINAPAGRRAELLDTLERRFDEPVKIRLSKYRYPAEDLHLDAIVWTTPAAEGQPPAGELEVLLLDDAGRELARHVIRELAPSGLFFSLGLPPALHGGSGMLEAVWRDGGREIGRAAAPFHVHAAADVKIAGRIPLRVINTPGATLTAAPMTLGVPFPRGALRDDHHVRLLDETGVEVPLQTRVTARWSRFGSIKWLLCDFTADLEGGPREFELEYGPDIRRMSRPSLPVAETPAGFPGLDAGRIRVDDDGVSFDPDGSGRHRPVLPASALAGAFVQHENGRRYVIPHDVQHVVEELGSEKAVIRRTGWYAEADGDRRFCNFVTRLVFHRDSPVVRIFHTWIFTGNGNRDRIREMGWRFDTVAPPDAGGFLLCHDKGEWAAGDYLVQFDHQTFNLADRSDIAGRTPGVLSAVVGDTRVSLGVKDFWQNFPNELELDAGGFSFYNWPRHNPPATFARPVERAHAFLHRFAHEGEVLDFRLPDEYTDGDIWQEACSRELHWAKGRPESANAQGIARTEEMLLYFADKAVAPDAAALVMRGFNDESLRAVADPAWVAASDVFGAIHHRDDTRYAEDEHIYEQVVHAPARWNERLGFYGMWLYGDVPAWGINLEDRTVALYRAIRKNHHGWPVGWVPYARSGDPRLLKYAEAATRQMTDANFCHYADADTDAAVGEGYYRRQGWWDRSLLPWAARRGPLLRNYTVDCDYIWHAYYLTGYARARDVALLFGALTQHDHGAPRGPRTTSSMLPSYLDMYQATFDPWFLAAAHEIAGLHMMLYPQEEQLDNLTHASPGHFWRPADEYFHRFTGADDYRLLALNHSIGYSSPRSYAFGGLWSRLSVPYINQAAYAWELTGDEFHLRRLGAYLDWPRRGVYDGDVEYYRGSIVQGGTARGIFTGYYIRYFPRALGAFERAGRRPDPIPNPFFVDGRRIADDDKDIYHFRLPEVIVGKRADHAINLSFAAGQRDEDQPYYYTITAPDGSEYLSDIWPLDFRPHTADIAADARAGDYRVVIGARVPLQGSASDRARIMRRHGGVIVPLAPPDIPEVMVFDGSDTGTRVASGGSEIQYWFRVPEDIDSFWIEFDGGSLCRLSVWTPDRERAWDGSYAGSGPERVEIMVPAGQSGRVWGASGGAFRLDPRIAPYFAVTPEKWFQPGE